MSKDKIKLREYLTAKLAGVPDLSNNEHTAYEDILNKLNAGDFDADPSKGRPLPYLNQIHMEYNDCHSLSDVIDASALTFDEFKHFVDRTAFRLWGVMRKI